ncbi:acyl-CoA dehydrogenase family protein [Microbacterium sp. SLBN-111]|uniref:acyl-CoA dehydrogenase family protein n=1 Tax=Microbacterium sp. SLBN-111 TaxID=3377733 RepID=UPI003C791DA6
MNPYEHRRRNVSLDEDDQTIAEAFADFFGSVVSADSVRQAEAEGIDRDLWQRAVEMGVTSMALPEHLGGDDAGVFALALVAGEAGRVLAPIPFIDHVVATRLLVATGDPAAAPLIAAAAAGETILAFAARSLDARRLVAGAAIATYTVGFDGTDIVVVSADEPRARVRNRAHLPSAWVDPAAERNLRLASPDAPTAYRRARDEWNVLTAAALAGLTAGSLALGAESTKTRETMGVPLGMLQGVAFPLVDAHIGAVSARSLALRAAWFLDHEPDAETHLPAAALVYAHDVAVRGTNVSAHVQGGLGFTNEAPTTPYFLRAHGWALAGGDLRAERRHIVESELAARRAARALAPDPAVLAH